MENPPASSSGSFAFRLIIFFILLSVGIGGFSSLLWNRFNSSAQQQTNANAVVSPTTTPSPADNIDRAVSEPYVGNLDIFESPDREKNLQIFRVMDILGVKEGANVADIGAGSGWFTTRAARKIGAKGTAYAVEINQDYLNYINERVKKENLTNIKTVLGTEDNPKLPANSVDAVLVLKTYHEVAQPVRLLKLLKKAMRTNARLGIIDRNGKGDDHGIDQKQVVKEAEHAGFKLIETHDFVKPDGMDYFLVFQIK